MKTLLFTLLLLAASMAGAERQQATLIKVEDGDTLLVNLDGAEARIQLLGMDAPEDTRNPKFMVDLERTGLDAERLLTLGKSATAHLQSLVKPGERVTMSGNPNARDRYDRIPAEVFTASGLSLNVAMVADGYARILYTDGAPEKLRERLEAVWELANSKRPGLWSSRATAFDIWLSAQR